METNLVMEGVRIMLLGMGVVFLFVAVMIVAMNIMSGILTKQYPEANPVEINNQIDNSRVVAAIVAAIKYHRS